jgi:hypothetical protein
MPERHCCACVTPTAARRQAPDNLSLVPTSCRPSAGSHQAVGKPNDTALLALGQVSEQVFGILSSHDTNLLINGTTSRPREPIQVNRGFRIGFAECITERPMFI